MVDMLGAGFVLLVYVVGIATGWLFKAIADEGKERM